MEYLGLVDGPEGATEEAKPAATRREVRVATPSATPAATFSTPSATGVTVIDESRCTAEDPTLYSYRRDGVTGRQAGVIWL